MRSRQRQTVRLSSGLWLYRLTVYAQPLDLDLAPGEGLETLSQIVFAIW